MEKEMFEKIKSLYFSDDLNRSLAKELLKALGENYELNEMFEIGYFFNCDLTNQKIYNDLSRWVFENCTIRNCSFEVEIFVDSLILIDSKFEDCHFNCLQVMNAKIDNDFLSGTFNNCKFDEIEIYKCTITQIPDFFNDAKLKFEESDFEGMGKEIDPDLYYISCKFFDCDFSNKHLDWLILAECQFINCLFVDSTLTWRYDFYDLCLWGDFRGATFYGNFEINGEVVGADFSESNLYSESYESMKGVVLPRDLDQWFIGNSYDFSETCFGSLPLMDLVFDYLFLYDVNFSCADLEGAIFIDCELDGANFEEANLEGAVFLNCDLSDTNFDDANMVDTTFKDCFDVKEIQRDSNYELIDGNEIEEVTYVPLKLKEGYFLDSVLLFDDFDDYCFFEFDFSGKYMDFVSFKNADLSFANFSNCILKDVDFTGANLSYANFNNAILINVVFEDAVLDAVLFDDFYEPVLIETYNEIDDEFDDDDNYIEELDWEDL